MTKTLALAITKIPSLRAEERAIVLENCYHEEAFSEISSAFLQNLESKGLLITKQRLEKWQNINGKKLLEEAEEEFNSLQKREILITTIFDELYPKNLKDISNPPFLLYYKGKFPIPGKPSLAVVGTRKPTLRGKQETGFFVRECCRSLSSIISGMALGIDSVAHRSALAEDQHTTAVMGGGFNHIFPKSNVKLASQILEQGGLILTEYPMDSEPLQFHFPERNRIVSGLSDGVLVIEAPLKSGTLITASYALEQDKDLFVHSASLELGDSGVSRLHEDGALALRRGADLLSLWNLKKSMVSIPIINTIEDRNLLYEKGSASNQKTYDINKAIADNLWEELGGSKTDSSKKKSTKK